MLNNKPCILIADDEPNICRIVKLIISPDNYDILTAENGVDAYEKTIKFQPSLVFSDILMPKCDGFELCNKIKTNEYTRHIPFIFLTGLDEKQFKARFEEVEADDYLIKPFSSQDMKKKINQWVKKPVIHSEEDVVPIENKAKDLIQMEFEFGVPELDAQLCGPIEPKTFILLNGPIGSGKSSLTRQFIMDGVQKKQSSLVLSFETPNEKLDPLFNLSSEQKKFVQCCNASRWTAIDSAPWRNIDYIFDYLSAECTQKNVHRIIIDSFSHGFAFWSLTDILRFVDLCRTLHNAKDQCILWSINSHPTIESIEYHLQHVMDIGVKMIQNNGEFSNEITYSKWQKKRTKHVLDNQAVIN